MTSLEHEPRANTRRRLLLAVVVLGGLALLSQAWNAAPSSQAPAVRTPASAGDRPGPGLSPVQFEVTHSHEIPSGGYWQNLLVAKAPSEADLRALIEWYRLAYARDPNAHLLIFDDSVAALNQRATYGSLTEDEQRHYDRHFLAVYTRRRDQAESAIIWPEGSNGRSIELRFDPRPQ